MPEFSNPFIGNVPSRKITLGELIRALRLDTAAELEATHLYVAQAEATDNELARKVLIDIANEERVHVGEFQRLIAILDPEEDVFLAEGAGEVNDMAAGAAAEGEASGMKPGGGYDVPTIGSMRQK